MFGGSRWGSETRSSGWVFGISIRRGYFAWVFFCRVFFFVRCCPSVYCSFLCMVFFCVRRSFVDHVILCNAFFGACYDKDKNNKIEKADMRVRDFPWDSKDFAEVWRWLLRAVVEGSCWELLLRAVVEGFYWELLLRALIEVSHSRSLGAVVEVFLSRWGSLSLVEFSRSALEALVKGRGLVEGLSLS